MSQQLSAMRATGKSVLPQVYLGECDRERACCATYYRPQEGLVFVPGMFPRRVELNGFYESIRPIHKSD